MTAAALVRLDVLGWQDSALCSQTDPEVFFPAKGQPSKPAKAVCAKCPVIAECLQLALANQEMFGVWGGTTEHERRELRATVEPVVAAELCRSGLHVLAGTNVRSLPSGQRRCVACKQASTSEYWARYKAAGRRTAAA